MINFANVLLVSKEGDVLTELLKAAPGFSDGDRAALFGGELAQGEKSRDTAIRTVQEQTGLEVSPHALRFCGTYYQGSEDYEVHVFAVENIDPYSIQSIRGGTIYALKPNVDLDNPKLNELTREIICDFYISARR
jgi:8-oxo-dGTP pyrophosphatase MutT (NUDIX family)